MSSKAMKTALLKTTQGSESGINIWCDLWFSHKHNCVIFSQTGEPTFRKDKKTISDILNHGNKIIYFNQNSTASPAE